MQELSATTDPILMKKVVEEEIANEQEAKRMQ